MKKTFKMTAVNSTLGNLEMTGDLPLRAAQWDEAQIKACMFANLDLHSADSHASLALHSRQLAGATSFSIVEAA